MRSVAGSLLALALVFKSIGPVLAHPHVWVASSSEIVFDGSGRLTGVRHAWTFDQAYSAFAVTGLDSHRDGKPDPDKLVELANSALESLKEFKYFTQLKVNGRAALFDAPADYGYTFSDGRLTLRFTLPIKAPSKVKVAALQVDDPTFFVAFNLADHGDAVRLVGPATGCVLDVKRPDKPADEGVQLLADDVAQALAQSSSSTSVGEDYTGHIMVACP